jgi:spermidine synthase
LSKIDLIMIVLACAAAIGLGARLAHKQARAFKAQTNNSGYASGLPEVTYTDYSDMRFLHLGTPAVQGSMKITKPFDIHLDYVQRMMAWLLFTDLDRVRHMHAMQLGLGAAALTKFCHHHLEMQTTAIELNPHVIAACRNGFELPPDNPRLNVLQADAAEAVKTEAWRGSVHALQVDLYDQEAAHPVLDSEDFYRHCKSLLTPDGCMVVNVFGRHSNIAMSLTKISAAFGPDTIWTFKPNPSGNTIVLAFDTPRTFDKTALLAQAQKIEARWPLAATKWLKVFGPAQIKT